MTQEEKYLLLKDLSARLPYGVKAYVKNWSKLDRKYYEGVYTVESVHPLLNNVAASSDKFYVEVILGYDDYVIKPYLFPMSSMTREQEIAIRAIQDMGLSYYHLIIDHYNEWHLDYRDFIGKGLANDATGLNIY